MDSEGDKGVRHRCPSSESQSGPDHLPEWDQPRKRYQADCRRKSKSPRRHKHSHHPEHDAGRSESPASEDARHRHHHHHYHHGDSSGQRPRRQRAKAAHKSEDAAGPRHCRHDDLNSGFRGSSSEVMELDDGDDESLSSHEVSGTSSQYMTAGQDPSPPDTYEGAMEQRLGQDGFEKAPKMLGDLMKVEMAADPTVGGQSAALPSSLPHLGSMAGLQATAALDASISSSIQILQYYQQQQMLAAHFGLTGLGHGGLLPGLPLAPTLAMPSVNALHAPLHPCSCITCQSAILSHDLARYLPQMSAQGIQPLVPNLPSLQLPQPQGQAPPSQNQDVQALLRLLQQNDGHGAAPACPTVPKTCQECPCEAECDPNTCGKLLGDQLPPPSNMPLSYTATAPPTPPEPQHLVPPPMDQLPPGSPLHRLPVGGAVAANVTPLRQALSSTLCSSPLHSLMTQLNESGLSSVSAIQFQSPDKYNTSRGEDVPPIGVFWDIENCAVPRGKSALSVVQRIRDHFFTGHREAEFMCVCDINKESNVVIQELNDAQVTVAHINATAKNAADDKLRQSLRRFADTHSSPATVVLISGDINFARDLSDLRHRNGLNVVLVHGQSASEALKTCANTAIRYDELLADLPFRSPVKGVAESSELIVFNLPARKEPGVIRGRLKQLSDNCGGKVGNISNNVAYIKFPSHEIANRAKKRLDGEKVFGNIISTSFGRSGRPGFGSPRYGRNNIRRDSDSCRDYVMRERQEEVSSNDSYSSQGTNENQREEPEQPKLLPPPRTLTPQLALPQGLTTKPAPAQGPAPKAGVPRQGLTPKPIPIPVAEAQETTSSPLGGRAGMQVCSGLAAAFKPIHPSPAPPPLAQSSQTPFHPHTHLHPQPQSQPQPQPQPPPQLPPQPPPQPYPMEGISLVMDGAATKSYPAGAQSLEVLPSSGKSRWRPLIPTPPPPIDLPAFHSAPAVQRVTGAEQGPQYQLRKDGTPGNPCLKGAYRAPSPLMVTSKLKPSWAQQQAANSGGQPQPPIKPWTPMPGIDLLVTNLDSQMSRKELKRHLVAAISEHCKVLHVFLAAPSQGYFQAVVRVPCMGDALGVMANVNRRQIGTRLLHISILPPGDSNADKLRMMLIQMLQEVPGMCMPLFKLKQAFESRYQQQLFVSDLYHIPDTVNLQDGHGGKLVCLTALSSSSSPAPGSYSSPVGWQPPTAPFLPPREPSPEPSERFCLQHDSEGQSQYRLLDTDLCVTVAYQTFTAQVTTLLNLHHGSISLISFPLCYSAEYSALEEDYEGGIPLEHLLNSVPGVRVAFCREGYKVVCWSQLKDEIITDDGTQMCTPLLGRTTPLLPPPLFQFSKEVVELLKHSNKCRLPFTRFVPAYHHHFGRQVRVADYGYLKLIELFEAISHVLEILGATENKTLTLTHRAQVKRFGQDLLKVLKSQASKKVTVRDFSSAFQRCLGRKWDTVDYGVCDIQDLLFDLPENWVSIDWAGENTLISIPKREQTEEERIRTKKFTREIVDLLSRQPRCRITFSKFIPAYHHHFGRQCRVGEYGFNKLAELLGALPEVVQIEEYGDERSVQLTEAERLAVMARRLAQLIPRNRQNSLALSALLPAYCKVYGHPVCLEDYGVNDLESLVKKFCHIVEIVAEDDDKRLHSVERQHLSDLTQQVLVVLLGQPGGRAPVEGVVQGHAQLYGGELVATEYGFSSVTLLLKALHHVVTVRDEWSENPAAELTPTYQFARTARDLLLSAPGQTLSLQAFVGRYADVHGHTLQPHDFGQTTVSSLVAAVPRVLALVGRGAKRAVTLNPCCYDVGQHYERSLSSEYNKTSPSDFPAGSTSTSEKESRKSSSSNSISESDGAKSIPPPASPCDLLSQETGPSSDHAPCLEPSSAPTQARDLIEFASPRTTVEECIPLSQEQEKMEHIDLMSLIHLLPDPARLNTGRPPLGCPVLRASTSVSHSTSFDAGSYGGGGGDDDMRRERPAQRQASSLPSSAASSPRRNILQGRSRFRLAANFSLGFQEG